MTRRNETGRGQTRDPHAVRSKLTPRQYNVAMVTPGNSHRQGRLRHHSADEARATIVDAAIEFLWDHPVRELTAGELMKKTGLSRPAFYQYFSNVPELIRTILVDLQVEMVAASGPWLNSNDERSTALEKSLAGVIEVCVRRGPLFRAVFEAAPQDPDLERAWNDFMHRWDGAVAARIVAEQGLGIIDPKLDPMSIAHALNAMDAILLVQGFGRRNQANPKSTLRTLHTIWMRTLYNQE